MQKTTLQRATGRPMDRITHIPGALFLIACVLTVTITAQADFRRDYSSGVRDFDSGKYERAIKDLKNAIEDESSAKNDVRFYGMSFAPYLPYFFLGQSYFELKDCEQALSAWRRSLDEGVVKSHAEELAVLQKNQSECEQDTGKPPVALQLAVEEYFKGNFSDAAKVSPEEMAEPRAKVQALLFKSASIFNLFLLSGEQDEDLLQLSRKIILEIKDIDSGFSPYEGAFSPRYLQLFRELFCQNGASSPICTTA